MLSHKFSVVIFRYPFFDIMNYLVSHQIYANSWTTSCYLKYLYLFFDINSLDSYQICTTILLKLKKCPGAILGPHSYLNILKLMLKNTHKWPVANSGTHCFLFVCLFVWLVLVCLTVTPCRDKLGSKMLKPD